MYAYMTINKSLVLWILLARDQNQRCWLNAQIEVKINKLNVVECGLYSYRYNEYVSSQWSKRCGLARCSRVESTTNFDHYDIDDACTLLIRVETTLNYIWFVFYHNIKDNERNAVKICWQLKPSTQTWKCTCCTMQMSYLYASDLPVKNFCKPVQHDAYSLSIKVQTTLNHISTCFFPTIYQHQRKYFFRAGPEKGIAWHIDVSNTVWTLINNSKLANQIARLVANVVK